MKRFITPMMALLGLFTLVQAQDSRIKSWKTLTNENGFEFKYPDCWVAEPDNPDEVEQPVSVARDIRVEETNACAQPLLDPPHQNTMSFSGGWVKTTKEQSLKNIEGRERNAKHALSTRDWLYFKRLNVGSDDAVVEVEFSKNVKNTWIRWKKELYCPTRRISVIGPSIKDPDPSYFEKFKAGDMSMPEPERTIFESIRCVKPKAK